jgi:hypothetical protein
VQCLKTKKGVIKNIVGKVEDKKITIDMDELRKRKIFVATPMYGGMCTGAYTHSLLQFSTLCRQYDLHWDASFHYNESLIQRARNYLVDGFLRSDCTHLMFIDSDIAFNPMDILGMLALADKKSDYDVLCGLYPKKQIHWDRIKKAVEQNIELTHSDELAQFGGGFAFNLLPETESFKLTEPVQILEGATGFMLVQRHVFDQFKAAYPEKVYTPDHKYSTDFNGDRNIVAYFDCEIDPISRRYLSEDYYFSRKIIDIGLKVWACPWITLTHIGTYAFQGSLSALSSISAPPN